MGGGLDSRACRGASGDRGGWVSQCASVTAPRPMSRQHVVQHTSRSFCGQIGSHKVRDVTAEPAGPGGDAASVQMGHLGWPIEACSRHACIRLHGLESWGSPGCPPASLIYAPAVQVQLVQGFGSLTKHFSSKPPQARSHQLRSTPPLVPPA